VDGARDTVVATVPVGQGPLAVGVNPDTNRVYVANSWSDDVSVIDTTTNEVVATVSIGRAPWGIAVNPHTNRIYIANAWDSTISVIDGAAH
jgi:YVTN family beta-propeller protein